MAAPNRFPIVGVGASAGGIEALEGFFRGMPDMPGLCVVIVTHLSPERESLLHEIVVRFTDLTVRIAAHDDIVAENTVYVLPANAVLSIVGGRLSISRPDAMRRERKPIDIFLSALAKDQGEYAAGVILSGGDSDGTLGIKAIKEHGGLTLAQVANGFGPGHPDMPNSAISTGYVDFSVPAEEMGPKLALFVKGLALLDAEAGKVDGSGEEGRMSDAARREVYAILRKQIGHDFSGYKAKTFVRRVYRRMQIVQLFTIDAYVERLRADASEVNALFRDLLINVTNFFRDRDAFQSLSDLVIPKLFEDRGAEDTVRVWVPGCATGEEVYSIAILLREHMETRRAVPRVQIFATDIDERALGVARAARYPAQLLDSVTPERRRFFIPDGGSFVIAKEVRDLCIFSPHSVIRDPPFSRLDLVSCRNLLIYFGADAQSQVLPTFHYALKPGGYMFLGMAENVSQFADLFAPLDKKHRLFRSRERAGPGLRLPAVIGSLVTPANLSDLKPRRGALGGPVVRQSIEAQVLDRFAPAHVVTNRDGEVVHYSARTGKYLEAPPGGPSRQIVTMARRGLRLELRGALREAAEGNATVTREGVAVEGDDGRVQMVTLTVTPVADTQGSEPLYLILFVDDGPAMTREAALQRAVPLPDSAMLNLERELRETRERLQSLVEEYETALEELKSSNEELVSVNEELQSTNEELEASKEELQSVNEELHTVNGELNAKVEALDRANSDLQNLFESSDLATVFLDAKLVIRSFTPAVSTIFNVLPSDRGRPITDLAGRFSLPDLATDVATVIRDGRSIERRIDLADERTHYVMRFAPYRNGDGRIEGAVVTFLDVTNLTQAETHQRVLIAELQHRTRNLLGVVQSIANQTLGNGGSLGVYLERLKALGRVQGLLSHSDDEPITIGGLVRLELEAMGATDKGDRIHVAGPDVSLHRSIVQTLALGLHELATNAFKYGALANERGRLAVTWRLDDSEERQPCLILDWVEQDIDLKRAEGEQVVTRQGFGRELIERALPHDLGARTSYALDEAGVRCRIELPLSVAPIKEPRS